MQSVISIIMTFFYSPDCHKILPISAYNHTDISSLRNVKATALSTTIDCCSYGIPLFDFGRVFAWRTQQNIPEKDFIWFLKIFHCVGLAGAFFCANAAKKAIGITMVITMAYKDWGK